MKITRTIRNRAKLLVLINLSLSLTPTKRILLFYVALTLPKCLVEKHKNVYKIYT